MPLDPLTAAAATWFWANYGKDITDRAKGEVKERWKQFQWNSAAQAYRNKVSELYGTIRILGKPEPVALEGIFTDVFILDKPTAFRRYDITQLRADPEQLGHSVRRIGGLELVKHADSRRLFILGKPGAGKTTFLKYVALQAVQDKLDMVPIFVSLKEWADSGLALMPFLVSQFKICNFPDAQAFIEQLLRAGNAIVLFDGLDEVSAGEGQRDQLTAALRDFSKQYDRCQCLMTCRIAATDYTFERFTYVELADFNDEQITTFVTKWFQDSEVKREMFLRDFAKPEQRGLRELASSPLLLSLLCLSFDATLTFPQRRVEIYEEALEALLKKWDASRGIRRDEAYRELSLRRKRQLFARIAYETFAQGHYFVRQDELAKLISDYMRKLPSAKADDEVDGEAVLKAIEAQHGILVERARRIYSFAHLTFQEYFTAKDIVDNTHSEKVSYLLTPEHILDSHWREIVLLTASLLHTADPFFSVFKTAENSIIVIEPKLKQLLQWARSKADSVNAVSRPALVRALYLGLGSSTGRMLTHDLALTLARNQGNGVLSLTRDLLEKHDLCIEFFQGRAVAFDHTRNPFLIQASDFATDLILDFGLINIYLSALALGRRGEDFEELKNIRSQFPRYYSQIISMSRSMDSSNLSQVLTKLFVPYISDGPSEWSLFATNLGTVMQNYRNISLDWNLTETQRECLSRYVAANELLVECLRLAVVTDKQAIEDSLLLPPG